MKTATEWNLDCPNEVSDFILTHNTTKGRALANALGLKGKGACTIANSLSGYAWNKWTAMGLRSKGDITGALKYEGICDWIYKTQIPAPYRW